MNKRSTSEVIDAACAAEDASGLQGPIFVGTKIGNGCFAKVYEGFSLRGDRFGVKLLDKDLIRTKKLSCSVTRELNIMRRLSHPNIAKLHQVLQTPRCVYMIMELVDGFDLNFIVTKHGHLTEDLAVWMFLQVVEAIVHCHAQNIVHRDIKPHNIMFARNGDIKVIDFGLAADLREQASATERRFGLLDNQCGTPLFVAPEVVKESPITGNAYCGKTADIWALGVTLFTMTAGRTPFSCEDPSDLRKLFRLIKYTEPEYPQWFSMDLADLLRKMLQKDPTKRPSLDDIKSHNWCRGPAAKVFTNWRDKGTRPSRIASAGPSTFVDRELKSVKISRSTGALLKKIQVCSGQAGSSEWGSSAISVALSHGELANAVDAFQSNIAIKTAKDRKLYRQGKDRHDGKRKQVGNSVS